MENTVDIAKLIQKGGVLTDIEGSTPEEIYLKVSKLMVLPDETTSEQVYNALCVREKVLSTAVGKGIALPHARSPIITSEDEQRICVVYLKEPIDMQAPDEIDVSVMFVLLTYNSQTHLNILAKLVKLFGKTDFREFLATKPKMEELLQAINTGI